MMMGASVKYNPANGTTKVSFTDDGNAHLWFPKYEMMLELIIKSNIRKCSRIKFYQCFVDDDTFLSEPIPEDEMFVIRSIPHDVRSNGMPISIVIDFEK